MPRFAVLDRVDDQLLRLFRRDPALRNVAFVAQTSHEPANFFPPDRSQDPANRGGGSLDRARFYEHGMSQ